MNKNKVSKKNTYIIGVFTLVSIISCVIFRISLFYGFFSSIVLSLSILLKGGFTIEQLLYMIKNSLVECKDLFILILLIGATVPIWFSAGVIPTMMYYGFVYMQGVNLLFMVFIFTSIVSVFMGSAFAVISTVGIAILGVGKVFGIPDYILLGAIVSGAFLADKISPISGLMNLTLITTKTSYRNALSSMSRTLLPGYFFSGAVYFYLGKGYNLVLNSSDLVIMELVLKKSFYISPALLLLPVCMFILCFLGIKIIRAISLVLISGVVIAVTTQKVSLTNIFWSILAGYKGNTELEELNSILLCGGITSIVEILLIIIGAITLSSLFRGTGLIAPLVDRIIARVKSKREMVFKTSIISSILTLICDQSVGVILPGELLKNKYRELGIDNATLARTISDTGIIIAPLIPWNVNSLFILMLTGVSATTYAPYAVLCYALPLITVLSGCIEGLRKLPNSQ
ncbi:Na+/H+ antiporter NhaC family protein [Clostridium sp. A1-XYC3]|uniref:Na+/H+ antiporter NhaC family protein n=1 Tax=Clostridium tanneri TaxID=3037988 RepID=A0ABU4JWM0_9CLOT|nr:Na+/H+ antiporter NhaC family protein [Clostridium sp. A1-XYC3]MDW8802556.1 Na+/H+ antiporter NhaC family protein [Clostridium sp. A1-XYC3]